MLTIYNSCYPYHRFEFALIERTKREGERERKYFVIYVDCKSSMQWQVVVQVQICLPSVTACSAYEPL